MKRSTEQNDLHNKVNTKEIGGHHSNEECLYCMLEVYVYISDCTVRMIQLGDTEHTGARVCACPSVCTCLLWR